MRKTGLGFIAAYFLVSISSLLACGLEWAVPTNHFSGVNEQGYVSRWEKIGELDLGEGLRLPLIINFNSSRLSNSPYLGSGWLLALLDSNIVQQDEYRFIWIQPDGWRQFLLRKKATDMVLNGGGGWLAEIKDDQIILSANCGWRLIYTKGKISSIVTPKNRILNFIYGAGQVSRIEERGKTILEVMVDPKSGQSMGISYGGQKLTFEWGDKPKVQNIGGQNVVAGIEQSLVKIKDIGGATRSYAYAVNEKLQPTLKIEDRIISWDPASYLILKDGEWSYQITPNTSPLENAIFKRTDARGRREMWEWDAAKGREVTQSLDGTLKTKTWFLSGITRGKVRSLDTIKPNSQAQSFKYSYDELGRLIRILDSGKEIESIVYNDNGKIITRKIGDKEIQRRYAKDGSIIAETAPKFSILYDAVEGNPEFLLKKTVYASGITLKELEDKNGRPIEAVDSTGRTTRFVRADSGEITSVLKDGALNQQIFIDSKTGRKLNIYYTPDGNPDFAIDAVTKQHLTFEEMSNALAQK